MLLRGLRALWQKIAYGPVDPDGPAAAFARTMAAAVSGDGLSEVLPVDDGVELLRRALAPETARGELAYPGWDQVQKANKEDGFRAGIVLLAEAARAEGYEPGDALTIDLLVGTVIPVPGPGRVPLIHEVHTDAEDGSDAPPRFARVEYAYAGDPGGHALHFYRTADGRWLVDLVWELARGGAMQAALGNVQGTGCPTEKLEV